MALPRVSAARAPGVLAAWRKLYWAYYELRSRASSRVSLLRWRAQQVWGVHRDFSSELTIGVTTYVDRYDTWFKALLRQLRTCFPRVRIVVAVNGFHDDARHQAYLGRIRSDFENEENVTFVLHQTPRGLTRLWNEVMALASTPCVLMLNDDLTIDPALPQWVADGRWRRFPFSTVNQSWSHYFLTRECYERVGPFDEGFVGIGFEDIDYLARMTALGIAIGDQPCPFVHHGEEKPTETSFDRLSAPIWGKYTSRNHEYFWSKWEAGPEEGSIMFVNQFNAFIRGKGGGQPARPPTSPNLAELERGSSHRFISLE